MTGGRYVLVRVAQVPAFNRWFPAAKAGEALHYVEELQHAGLEVQAFTVEVRDVREADLS